MSIRSKLIVAAAVASFGVASPAFAQAFNPSDGTGNTLPSYYDNGGGLHEGIAPQNSQIAVHRNGLSAFARIPRAAAGSDDPGATGGGSVGYNENLRTDAW